ncbi:MAG: hydrogenase maturation protease [Planctomycetes bacterium]|nr:hydrogenase maturation protease [Planctomycetota bacterium]
MASDHERAPVLVLGLGNLLLQDDAVGLSLGERLRAAHGVDARVEFVDGGTQGLALLGLLDGRRAVLLLDAVSRGDAPGTVHRLDDALAATPPGSAGATGGAHQQNAGDLLLTARLLGSVPPRVAVVGVEPALLRTSIGLSDAVAAALPMAVATAHTVLRELLAAEEAPCTS